MIDELFTTAQTDDGSELQFIMSFFEIYNDKVHDLLKAPTFSPQNSDGNNSQMYRESLDVREKKDGNFVIHNLKKIVVNTRQESYI